MSFADDIKKFAEKSNNTVDEVIIHFVLDLAEKVIVGQGSCPGTPVKTGWAINNWVASVDTPKSVIPNAALKTGADAMQGVKFQSLTAPGKVFYLTNNVEYINELEYWGHSNQAPHGFARIGALAAKKDLDNLIGYTRVK